MNLSDRSLTALHRSWGRFKFGLVLFIIGATLLITVSHFHAAIYYLSLIILFVGFVIAMSGYLTILWQRLKGMNPANKRKDYDPFK
ncbi:hypothetical protein [Alteromonas confluentis]|uniref:Uncharacterized protein n=1 Tax=Alteromonas confluentis TaxID=1656094 RepID=A0A1E7ZDK6_9ALTE|nr:hypothetical protein [Alteromonas confluentis]OFC71603.1 hypothetical protein BFC18_07690 [Alteromonas confluentis]